MHNEQVERVLCEIQRDKQNIDLFSKAYFYDNKYAAHRSQVVLWGGVLRHRTRLSLLIREGMRQTHRDTLFSGAYDLGNMKRHEPEFCKLDSEAKPPEPNTLTEELNRDLWQENKLHEKQDIDRDDIRKLCRRIEELTGRKMASHYECNKSTAFKVLKLLCRVNNPRFDSENAARKPQLMALLEWPASEEKKKYSLSFRDAYAYRENKSQVWLIADMKAYLSAELDDERHEKIGALQYLLHDRIDDIELNVKSSLHRLSYADQVNAYHHLANEISQLPISRQSENIALDEELYFHLNALEFAHFAIGYQALLNKAKLNNEVKPVWSAIDRLAKDIRQSESVGMHTSLFSANDLPNITKKHAPILSVLVGQALGKQISAAELRKCTKYIVHLLWMHAMFRKQWLSGDMHAPLFTPLEWVAAMCCVYEERAKPGKLRTQCEPYWRGQDKQPGSVLSALKTIPNIEENFEDSVPEEHRHIWINRLEWCMAALQNHSSLKAQQFAFRSALVGKMKDIARTNNLACVHSNLDRLGLILKR